MKTIQKFNSTNRQMSCLRYALLFILTMSSFSILFAQDVKVDIRGIRNDKGSILIMAQAGKDSKPIYNQEKANKGNISITLKAIPWKEFTISVFHDENGNWQMDMNEQGMPAEGKKKKNCQLQQDTTTNVKIKLFYPEIKE